MMTSARTASVVILVPGVSHRCLSCSLFPGRCFNNDCFQKLQRRNEAFAQVIRPALTADKREPSTNHRLFSYPTPRMPCAVACNTNLPSPLPRSINSLPFMEGDNSFGKICEKIKFVRFAFVKCSGAPFRRKTGHTQGTKPARPIVHTAATTSPVHLRSCGCSAI